MPINPQFLIRDLDGLPQPSPELVQRIKRYDERMGLRYTKSAWAITETWRENDPRRRWIQDGSMDPRMAFDICGYLPVTCALDEAPAFIQRELTSWSPEQFKGLREAVAHWNDVGQDQAVMDKVLSETSNALDRSNDVTKGLSEPVGIDLKSDAKKPAKKTDATSAVAA